VNVAHCSNPSYCSFPRLPSSLSSTYRFRFPFPDLPHPTARLASKQASKQARTRTGRHCNAHPLPQSFQPACGLSPHLAPQSVACTRCPHRTAVFYNSIPASKAPPGRLGQGSEAKSQKSESGPIWGPLLAGWRLTRIGSEAKGPSQAQLGPEGA
jgi:hypothetical protein